MADFKKSLEFQRLLSNRALMYYYHGYQTWVSQFADAASFLDIYVWLANAPELEEEVLCELPKALLHAAQEEKAPKDPGDQMVKDVFPLKVAFSTSSDESAPSSPAISECSSYFQNHFIFATTSCVKF
ncbi:UNVERIFIED_CONTAM: hypothetical protein Slati_2527000 [Sesamum latifolium]|uniref:Uncharacterized protein n=1 Tax=Sesamum latifolium TaxID=2727402 RepID=A0AAW2WF58_9LAMI